MNEITSLRQPIKSFFIGISFIEEWDFHQLLCLPMMDFNRIRLIMPFLLSIPVIHGVLSWWMALEINGAGISFGQNIMIEIKNMGQQCFRFVLHVAYVQASGRNVSHLLLCFMLLDCSGLFFSLFLEVWVIWKISFFKARVNSWSAESLLFPPISTSNRINSRAHLWLSNGFSFILHR